MTADLPKLIIGLDAAALDAAWLAWKSEYKAFCRKNEIRKRSLVEGEDGTFEGGFIAGIEYATKEIKRIVSAHAAALNEKANVDDERERRLAMNIAIITADAEKRDLKVVEINNTIIARIKDYGLQCARDAVLDLLPEELKEKKEETK